MSGIVGSRLNSRGSGLVGSLGTDGQVLTSSGAGAGAVMEDAGGGDFVKLATVTSDPASDATVDINGHFSSTYDFYKIYASEVCPGTDNQDFNCRVMISDSIDTNDIYVHANFASYLDSSPAHNTQATNSSDTDAPSDTWIQNANDQGNDATISSWLEMLIANPLSTAKHKMLGLKRHYRTSGTSGGEMLIFYSSCWVVTTSALTGISFHFTSGNIGGTYKLYGMK